MVGNKYFSLFIFSIFLSLNVSTSPVSAQDDGLLNSSFESGISSWDDSGTVTIITGEDTTTKGTNDTLKVKVSPLHGDNLVRLGSVKDISENMDVGKNSVSQTFTPNSDAIIVGFSLYSWEHRSGRDTFSIDVKQPSNPNKISITNRNSETPLSVNGQTCSEMPCVLELYSGSRGDFVDTGWQYVVISGLLPSDGIDENKVSVTYSLNGLNDSGHHSWAYIDSWNNDPVANFTASRTSTIEGNVSRFIDTSTDEDPDDKITKRIWEITYNNAIGGTQTETIYDAKEIAVIASNQGTVTAKLKVFDRFGGSDDLLSGESGPDGIAPSITYIDGPILASDLNTYNVVAGSTGNIITARYAKPGWDDQIVASWVISNGNGTLVQSEANNTQYPVPMMLKGVASIPFDAPDEPGTSTINLTLFDPDGSKFVSRNITVNILPLSDFQISQDDDGNDTPTTATLMASGQVNVGHLNKSGDVDYYKITDANGNNFPVGSEVFVRLRNVATDHDLFVVSKAPPGSENAYDEFNNDLKDLWAFSGDAARLWAFSGDAARLWAFSGDAARLWAFSGDAARLWAFSGDTARLWAFSGDAARLWAFSGDAARLWAFSGDMARLDEPDGISGVGSVVFSTPPEGGYSWQDAVENSLLHSMWLRDSELEPFSDLSMSKGFGFNNIPLSEALYLPLQNSGVGKKDIDIAETSLKDLEKNGYQVLSISANDGFDDEVIILKVNSEHDMYLAVASDAEFGSPYTLQVENSISTNLEDITNGACNGVPLVDPSASGTTGMMANANFGNEVMYVVNPLRMAAKYGQARWDAMFTKLQSLAEVESGKVLAIYETTKYADMDINPCKVEKANAVAKAIREAIGTYRGSAASVTLVGDDDILPHYRAIDPTDFSERDYAVFTPVSVSSPLYSAMFNSTILTDKYYASDYSVENMPFKLLIPEWAVSRLTETPEDIIASIDNHIVNERTIEMETAMVSAYDIVLDSGTEIASTLAVALPESVTEVPFNFDLSSPWYSASIRCHMLGDETFLGCQSRDIVSLNGHFTHDRLVSQAAFETGINDYLTANNIDEIANGNISGNHIYTPGCHAGLHIPAPSSIAADSSDVRNRNYSDFPSSYISNGATYLGSTGFGIAGVNTNVFSEKLMGIHTKNLIRGGTIGSITAVSDSMYMLNAMYTGISPYDIKAMYQNTLYGFAQTNITQGVDTVIDTYSGSCPAGSDTRVFSLTVTDGDVSNNLGLAELNKVCTDSGEYYEVDGKTTSIVNRPAEPVADFYLSSNEGAVHGIIIESADYSEESINPVFITPTTDNNNQSDEFAFCQDGRYWPSKLVDYSDDGDNTFLKLVAGQFICTDDDENTGIQRLYTDVTVRILRSTSSDHTPAVINSVEPQVNEQGNVIYYVEASDDSGIQQIVLSIYTGTGIKTIKSELLTGSGPYMLELNSEDSQLALNNNTTITVIDGGNNIAVASSKGRGMEQIIVNIEGGELVSSLSAKQLTATIPLFALRKAAANSMSYVWDFGDGHYETGALFNREDLHPDLDEDEDSDSASITTTHAYDTDSNIKVKFKVTDSSGGIGSDDLTLQYCGDPAEFSSVNPNGDLVQCDVTSSGNEGTKINITVKVAGEISSDFQYRLYLDYTGDSVSDLKLTYDNNSIGKTNKVDELSATVSEDKQSLLISFDLAPTGWTKDMPVNWYMETQSGVEKGKTIGSADAMPDSGYFSY